MSFVAHNTVAVVVPSPPGMFAHDSDPRFLMVEEHSDGRIVFNQPAGHLEAGETLAEAAIREALEETGWLIELTGLVGLYQFTATNGEHYLRVCFAGEALEHDPDRALDADIIACHWFSADDLQIRQANLRSPLVWQAVRDYLNGQCYPLDCVKAL